MRYLVSDIHGCRAAFHQLLEKIEFSDQDHLYILGDVLDRGFDPIGLLQDIMGMDNVTFIIGNHDFMLFYFVKQFGFDLDRFETEEEKWEFRSWVKDGALPTLDGFLDLPMEERKEIYKFLMNASVYETIEHEGKTYILTHAGIDNFKEDIDLGDYVVYDFLVGRPDYSRRYYQDERVYVVSGHTPTPYIRPDGKPEVFIGNGHIVIDCGAVFGGQLAAFCIETGRATYVTRGKQPCIFT